jgi:murein DD-endopeptidase MepM/ murein hydrolase activator NlpD
MFISILVNRLTVVILLLGISIAVAEMHVLASTTSIQEKQTDHWVWPVNGEITDTFGTRHGNHKGLDIAAARGDEIRSVDKGTVKRSYFSNTYGNVVFIKHPNGLETVYAHMSQRDVEEGVEVEIGEKIGEVGSTGVSTGDHLHFEVHKGEWNYEKNNAVDPLVVFDNEQHDSHKTVRKGPEESIVVSKQENNQDKAITVTVNKNDTLWALSIEHQVPVESIKDWNQLESSLILVGQELKIYSNSESNES